MTKLVWDKDEDKIYTMGLDRGVLYFDHLSVPWNGLVSIEQIEEHSNNEVFFDGHKVVNRSSNPIFSAKVEAVMFPDEFLNYSGYLEDETKLKFDNQSKKAFGMSYRTLIGNAVDGNNFGYKIHILYNAVAFPSDESYSTDEPDLDITPFSWTIQTIPEKLKEYNNTAYAVIDSRYTDSDDLKTLEDLLYGTENRKPRLPSLSALIEMLVTNSVIIITDNGDGTWTAEGPDELITMLDDSTFQITEANAIYLDADTYTISNS